MKKLIIALLIICGACDFAYSQAKPMLSVPDTSSLKTMDVGDGAVMSLAGYTSSDPTGSGLYVVIDSTYSEGSIAFDHPTPGKQWASVDYINATSLSDQSIVADTTALKALTTTTLGARAYNKQSGIEGEFVLIDSAYSELLVGGGRIAYPSATSGKQWLKKSIYDQKNDNTGSYVSVITYNAIPNDGIDDSDAINSALSNHKNVIIGSAKTDIFNIRQPLILNSNQTVVVNGYLQVVDSVTHLLASNFTSGGTALTVTDADQYYEAGDYIVVSDDNQDVQGGGTGQTRREGRSSIISSVSGNTINLQWQINDNFTTAANAKVGLQPSIFLAEGVDNVTIVVNGVIDGNWQNQYDVEPVVGDDVGEDTRFGCGISSYGTSGDYNNGVTIKGSGTIRDFVLHNVQFKYTNDVIVTDVTGVGAHDKNFLIWYCNRLDFTNVKADSAVFEDGIISYLNTTDLNINNCKFRYNNRNGISTPSAATSQRINIYNSLFRDNGLHINARVEDMIIAGNTFYNGGMERVTGDAAYGVVIQDNNITFSDFYFEGLDSMAFAAIKVEGNDIKGVKIANGAFYNMNNKAASNIYYYTVWNKFIGVNQYPDELMISNVLFDSVQVGLRIEGTQATVDSSAMGYTYLSNVVFTRCVTNLSMATAIWKYIDAVNTDGLVFEDQGTAQVIPGATYTNIETNLYDGTNWGLSNINPLVYVFPQGSLNGASYFYYTDYSTKGLRVNVDSSPTDTINFKWEVKKPRRLKTLAESQTTYTPPEPGLVAQWDTTSSTDMTLIDTAGTYDNVYKWASTSGTYIFTQVDTTKMPHYNTDSNYVTFDGNDDRLYIDYFDANHFNPGLKDFAFSFWFKADTQKVNLAYILQKSQPSGGQYRLYTLKSESDIKFYITDGSNTAAIGSGQSVLDNNWHFFWMKYDRDVGITVCVDDTSNQVSNTTSTWTQFSPYNMNSTTTALNLGNASGGTAGFQGSLTKFRYYYNFLPSDDAFQTIYEEGR